LLHPSPFEWRLNEALADAAVDLHPGWQRIGDGEYRKLDDEAPEWAELIDWRACRRRWCALMQTGNLLGAARRVAHSRVRFPANRTSS
jgi:hypothetical protein